MNSGAALVEAYLRVNGYLMLDEVPLVLPDEEAGGYRTLTDLDIMAVRWPDVKMGAPDAEGRILQPIDTHELLDVPENAIDVIIGEVKEGRAHLNRAIRSPKALRMGLERIGICSDLELDATAEALSEQAVVRLEASRPARQVRLVAFGIGTSRRTETHYVISLHDALEFVEDLMRRAHEVLLPSTLSDPVLGLLHLRNKFR
ncbi:MAG: hypothetical protein M8860_07070 [marine benthic group bacterium]|nr:hypothetical protein [Gemmatimonadota bacterium]MCL7962597.1 hypothetical protein [Candidatus Carthagonibacter metallireducens]MCL7968222.1 hypothetical protein [Gemmatimonadota bacterium]MCL7985669.1 hypothetical protein [Gemmatimonadota bacterium]MCL7989565.1 hypothetical protein [Gemmatimonadota bacterium]